MTPQPEIKANPGISQTPYMQPIPLPKNAQRHCSTKECDLSLSHTQTLSASAVQAKSNTNGVDMDDWVESENREERYPKARSSQKRSRSATGRWTECDEWVSSLKSRAAFLPETAERTDYPATWSALKILRNKRSCEAPSSSLSPPSQRDAGRW